MVSSYSSEDIECVRRETHPCVPDDDILRVLSAEKCIAERPNILADAVNQGLRADISYRATPARLTALQMLVSHAQCAGPCKTMDDLLDTIEWNVIARTDLFLSREHNDYLGHSSLVEMVGYDEMGKQVVTQARLTDEWFIREAQSLFRQLADVKSDLQFAEQVIVRYLPRPDGPEWREVPVVNFEHQHARMTEDIIHYIRDEYIRDEHIVMYMLRDKVADVPEYRQRLLDRNLEKLNSGAERILIQMRESMTHEKLRMAMHRLLGSCYHEESMRLQILDNKKSEILAGAHSPTEREERGRYLAYERNKRQLMQQKYWFLDKIIEEEKPYVMNYIEKQTGNR
jgi:hypothetical protein